MTIIFHHLMKTAGTALKVMYLTKYFSEDETVLKLGNDEVGEACVAWVRGLSADRLSKIKVVQGHLAYRLNEQFENTKHAAVVRSPDDQIISRYFHEKRNASNVSSARKDKIHQANLGVIDAAEEFDWFNYQSNQLAFEMGLDKPENKDDVTVICDQFDLHFTDEKLSAAIFILHHEFGWPLEAVQETNVNSSYRGEFFSRELKEEILEKSALDVELYRQFEARLDDRFIKIVGSNEPYLVEAWQRFRDKSNDSELAQYKDTIELMKRNKEINDLVSSVMNQSGEKDRLIQQLQAQLARR